MKRKRRPSVVGIVFLILLVSMAFMVIASEWTISTAGHELRTRALETCQAEIGYISDALYSQLTAIQLQNVEILNHESVLALAVRNSILDRYETVSYESAIMKLIRSRLAQLNLIASAQLYLPTIRTVITAQKAAEATEQETAELQDIIRAFPSGLFYTDEYIQTIIYFPHFLSWIIFGGILIDLLSPGSGIVNKLIAALGGKPVYFLGDNRYFRGTVIATDVWKNFGYGTIVYLAAITGIDSTLYEAAQIDGANRWQQVWHVTLPGIRMTVVLMMVLALGRVLNAGFDQLYNLCKPIVYESGDILDTFLSCRCFSFQKTTGRFRSSWKRCSAPTRTITTFCSWAPFFRSSRS